MACAERGLVVNITEAGAEEPGEPAAACPVRADLADVRTRRFFEAAPGEFFRMYGRGSAVENFHAAPGVPESALGYLSVNPDELLIMSGHLSPGRLDSLQAVAARCGVPLTVRRTGSPRAVTAEFSTGAFSSLLDLAGFRIAGGDGGSALFSAGIRSGAVPAADWSSWFRKFFAMEVVPALRPRSGSLLYSFMKIMAAAEAAPVNWSAAGSRCGISGACARDWATGLEALGMVDLVGPLPAPPPRRAKKRPKLFFNPESRVTPTRYRATSGL